jgi:hypothetical protein
MALGKVDRRHIARIFFPGLYVQDETPAISTETRTLIYEKCIRRAALDVNPFDQSRWPVNYSAAMTLYRDQNGLFHFGTIDFSARLLGQFGDRLLELFEQHEGLKGAFFVHELRGMKSTSHHDSCAEGERAAALADVLHMFRRDKLRPEDWLVDIGMEVRHEGHMLQWLTSAHRRILQVLLPSASHEQIDAVLKSNTQYRCDLSAQLGDLGGFRALPSSRGKADSVSYINVYTTDKSATYQLHDGLFMRRKPWHLFPAHFTRLVKDVARIAEQFTLFGREGLEGNGRMEIRVPLHLAEKVLLCLPDNLIRDSMASFDCTTLWYAFPNMPSVFFRLFLYFNRYFKYYRVAALYNVIKAFAGIPKAIRLQKTSLALGAIITYQINALIYRPAAGDSEKVLLEACCQHVPNATDSHSTCPIMYRRGAYFLSDIIRNGGTYHLPDTRLVGDKDLADLYRRDDMEDIQEEFNALEPVGEPTMRRARIGTRRRRKTLEFGGASENEGGFQDSDEEDIAVAGILAEGSDTALELSKIRRQFAADVFQLSPLPKGSTAASVPDDHWLLLNASERTSAKIDIFQSQDISKIFRFAQYRVLDDDDWRELVFSRYFPKKGAPKAQKKQHFPSAIYYRLWEALMEKLDDDQAGVVQAEIYAWFDALLWVPLPEVDRMWSTKKWKDGSRFNMAPKGFSEAQNCPRLAVNPRVSGSVALYIPEGGMDVDVTMGNASQDV